MEFEHVDGEDKGEIKLFALSTCAWCRKTKQLLTDLGVEYDYVYVDQLNGNVREEAINELEKWNPRCSFPTLVINEDKCVVGFKEDEIREAMGA